MQYAVYFLGLLVGQVHADCGQPTSTIEVGKCAQAGAYGDLNASVDRSKREYEDYVERTKPIQVITPNSSYLAYPSGDGKTISVYGGIGRGFDRE